MRTRMTAAAAALGLTLAALSACGGSDKTTTGEQSYDITGTVDALVVDARAASVTIETGSGPVTVKETYRYGGDKPVTSHQLDGTTLKLTDNGCTNDEVRCTVEFLVHLPAAASAQVKAQAGAVKVTGLAGNITVTTEAGAFEGKGLTGDEVTVTTQAGAATLEFAEAPMMVHATTQAGGIEVRVPSGTAYAVDAHTNVGGAEVSVDRDSASAHKIQVSAQLGGVSVENV